jgi:hypothetical protein
MDPTFGDDDATKKLPQVRVSDKPEAQQHIRGALPARSVRGRLKDQRF